jgi:transcriptional regulator with XRE-family HTH domain
LPNYGQYTAHMQELFSNQSYHMLVEIKTDLRRLRLAAGLSVRELARQIGEAHTNVSYWERSGRLPRSDKLTAIAKALGVTVEELLGGPRPRRAVAPGGKVGQVFEAVSQLPRRRQQKIIEVVEALIAQQTGG